MTYISKHRIFLTSDRTEAVLEGDPRAAFLLVCVGGVINNDVEAKYNLQRFHNPEVQEEQAPAQAPDDVEAKSTTVTPENKALQPQQNKKR